MNRNQRRVIWGAIAVLLLALLIPPWEHPGRGFWGYAPLFSTAVDYGAGSPVWWGSLIEHLGGLRVSLGLLLVEALFISLAAVGAVIALGNSKAVAGAESTIPRRHEGEGTQASLLTQEEKPKPRVRKRVRAAVMGALALAVAVVGNRLAGDPVKWQEVLTLGGVILAAAMIGTALNAWWRRFVEYLIDR